MVVQTPSKLKTDTFIVKWVEPAGILIQTFDKQEFIFSVDEINRIYNFTHGKRNTNVN